MREGRNINSWFAFTISRFDVGVRLAGRETDSGRIWKYCSGPRQRNL